MKRIIFIIAIILGIFTDGYSQLVIGKSAGQIITENAVKGSVVIVRQSYQVKNKKTGKIYGRNGRSDFGHFYSIGLKTDAGLVLTDGALKPWLFDTAFKKVEDEYEPIISLTEIRDIEDSGNVKFTQCPLKLDRNQPEGVWIANNNKIMPNAMELDLTDGTKDGWLIWYLAPKNLDDTPDSKISLQIVSKKVELSGSVEQDLDSPNGGSNVLGAIYVCPAYLGGGHVTYKLVGVAVKNDKQWKLQMPFTAFSFDKKSVTSDSEYETPKAEDANEEKQGDVELTPIEKGKKKSKKSKK